MKVESAIQTLFQRLVSNPLTSAEKAILNNQRCWATAPQILVGSQLPQGFYSNKESTSSQYDEAEFTKKYPRIMVNWKGNDGRSLTIMTSRKGNTQYLLDIKAVYYAMIMANHHGYDKVKIATGNDVVRKVLLGKYEANAERELLMMLRRYTVKKNPKFSVLPMKGEHVTIPKLVTWETDFLKHHAESVEFFKS